MSKQNELNAMNKGQFIRELSLLSGFAVADTEIFFNALIRLLAKCIEKQIPFVIRGFGSLRFSFVKAHKGYHGKLKKEIDLPATTRVNLTLSKLLRDYVKTLPESPNRQMSFLDE